MGILNREFFSKLLFELLTIIVGVLIALAVNEIRQDFAQKELANTAFKSIVVEIESNRKFLDERIPYYLSMEKTLDSIGTKSGFDQVVQTNQIPGWRGAMPPVLSDAAWQTSINAGSLAKVDFTLTTRLSKLYSFQAAYQKWIDFYLNALIMNQLKTTSEYRNFFKEMGNVGKELQGAYVQMSTLVKAKTENP